jgi:aminopeptidase N
VHNDPVNEPWLDEALAEYSMKIYMESQRGEDDAAVLVASRWETPLEGLAAKGQDTLVNQPVGEFLNGTQYETVVYGKGALFYEQVNDTVGTRRFDRFLQNYLKTHRYGIVDTVTWLNDLRDLPDPALVTLFEKWVALPDPTKATPTATPAETSAETSAESP